MRRLIAQEFVTLDNFAARKTGELDFMPGETGTEASKSAEDHQWEFLDRLDTMIIGRKTYEMFVNYWPTATERIASKLNALDKIVCTNTLQEAPWGNFDSAKVIGGDVVAQICELKKQPGKDLVLWGSITLFQNLCIASVIDEYQFVVSPTVLGAGKSLFPDQDLNQKLDFAGMKLFIGGHIVLTYTNPLPTCN